MARRRSDTRQRIQATALELFAERGYEQTSLREIAERLGVTKAALYYHFTTKEEILASLVEEVARSIDDLVAWAASQPPSAPARGEALERLAALAQGPWQPIVRLAQENQPALRRLGVGSDIRQRAERLFALFDDPQADVGTRVRGRLAVLAVLIGALRGFGDLGASAAETRAAAVAVARDLIAAPSGPLAPHRPRKRTGRATGSGSGPAGSRAQDAKTNASGPRRRDAR